jgi:hypothetical protein
VGLAVVRDLREVRAPAGPEEIEWFETDVVARFAATAAKRRRTSEAPNVTWNPEGREDFSLATSGDHNLTIAGCARIAHDDR